MSKSIKGILISLGILILVLIIGILPMMPTIIELINFNKSTITLKSKDSTVEFNEDGRIEVEDTVEIHVMDNKTEYLAIPLTLYEVDEEGNRILLLSSIESVTIDGKRIFYDGFLYQSRKDLVPYYYNGGSAGECISIRNANLIKSGVHTVKINYTYNSADIVRKYNNCTTFKIQNNQKIEESNIKIILPNKTKVFELKNKNAVITNINDNIYSLDISNTKKKSNYKYTEVIIDTNTLQNGQVINSDYIDNSKTNEILDNENINFIVVISILVLFLLVITSILSKKPKVNTEHIRDPQAVVEPIIAESIIDRKIGAKELIMSSIINLIHKGNLRNIGNEKIELINCDNLSEYEKDIVSLIFKENRIIEFSQIKNIFIKDNDKTKEFYNKFKLIKNRIEQHIYDCGIYNKSGEYLLKAVKVLILLMYVNIFYLGKITMDWLNVDIGSLMKYNIIGLIISSCIVFYKGNIIPKFNISSGNKIKISINMFFLILLYIVLIILGAKSHIEVFILIFILLVINTISLIKSSTHIFTSTGKIEYAKAIGLKRYIEDYSLMKERDVESVILWDEYLAYAVAFGISNKVMDKFNEGLMKFNVVLQKIDRILRI